jgi:diguanylate cyclase (GGDEF)-like protein
MINMKWDKEQFIYDLKSMFYEQMEFTNGRLQYEKFLTKLVLKIKELLHAEEATYYKVEKWRQELYIEASTEDYDRHTLEKSYGTFSEYDLTKSFYYQKHPLPKLQEYQLILPCYYNNRVAGILAVKEKKSGLLLEIGEETANLVAKESVKLIELAFHISNIASEEKRYKQLLRVTEKFHQSMDMDSVLGEIVATLEHVYPAFTYYLLISHDNVSHENLPIKDLGYDSENVSVMQAYVTGHVQLEELVSERKVTLYAPLKGKQGVYGVLQVIAPNTVSFPETEVEFITVLANTGGSALENAQLYQQSKRLISDLQLINETSHKLNSNLRLNEAMEHMNEQIMKSFQADESGFILIHPDSGVEFFSGSSDFFASNEAVPYIEFLKDKIDRDKEALFIGDLNSPSNLKNSEYRSLMAVPLKDSDAVKGFVVVLHKEPYHFSFEMFKLLRSLVHHSSLAFANAMLREELEKMVITDHLTKLYSRNYLDEKVLESMEKDYEGTFILIDIDDFKKVNDTYGHQIGDDILIQVSKLIQANIRETDVGARWGGEELAIYLPRVSLETGVQIARRIREKVSEKSNPKVTISCGVSYWSNEKIDDAKLLFKRADEALYVAKNTGKNQVTLQFEKNFSESINKPNPSPFI